MVDETKDILAAAPPLPPSPETLRTAEEFRAAASALYSRWMFLNQAGITFGGLRDTYQIFGYKRQLSIVDYRDRYERGGLAGALVDIMPDATWRGTVEVREDKDEKTDTEFEKAWKSLDQRLQVQAKMLRVDKLSRLSNYAVLLIGVKGDATLDQELPKGSGPDDVIFFDPFTGGGGPGAHRSPMMALSADATIAEYETDTKNPRFGQPKTYNLKRLDINVPDFQRPVHHSRILHIAEGVLDNDVFGKPALERSWNHFDDLEKVTGGGAEAFWLRANAGLHLDVDKDMALATPKTGEPSELDKLKQQAEDYAHQMTRMMRTRGVDIKQLGSDVANFNQPADAIITQIAGANRIPKRILTGSEMGELASSQDRDNWRDNVNGRQTQYAGPYIIRPLIDRLIKYGYLPSPVKGPNVYDVVWPHIQTMTEQEKDARATALATVNKTQGEVVYTNAEIRDMSHGKAALDPKEIVPVGAPVRESAVATDNPDALLKAAEADPLLQETLRALEAAIEDDDLEAIGEILALGDAPGHEFHGNQYTGASGAVGGRKGENFVAKAHDPASYGSHSKNIKDPKEAAVLFEQSHAALEKQGYSLDKPTTLPFEYRREATFTHAETGHTAVLRKSYFSADPRAKAAGYKGTHEVSLKLKKPEAAK